MTDQEDNIKLRKIVYDEINQEKKSWFCFGPTCSRSLIIFVPIFCHFVEYLSLVWRIYHQKFRDESNLGMRFLRSATGYFLPSSRL